MPLSAISSPLPTATPSARQDSGAAPLMALFQEGSRRDFAITHTPFLVGRQPPKDLVIPNSRVSREHAQIVAEAERLVLVDLGSKHGTFVNGQRIQRHTLAPNDRIEFGARDGAYVVFQPSSSTGEFLGRIRRGDATDLEHLKLFLQAVRKLNSTGVVSEVLSTLLDATLGLTRSQRAYVFLRDPSGALRLAAGRNARGEALCDDRTISHSVLEDAANSSQEFRIDETTPPGELRSRRSVRDQHLRRVICIPLRKVQERGPAADPPAAQPAAMGVLYLDSRTASPDSSTLNRDLLRAIALEAAAVVENARLAETEEAARRTQQELEIAAHIQRELMLVNIPEVPFASLQARSLPCQEIGGDFYDVVRIGEALGWVIADACGRGVTAATLASVLKGMFHAQLEAQVPLAQVPEYANRFLYGRELGDRYATAVLGRLSPGGEMELLSCGHPEPLLLSGGRLQRLRKPNFPVGLLGDVTYQSATLRLQPGDRLVVVSDGVTEAENESGEFFGDERLEQAALSGPSSLEAIFQALTDFCGAVPFGDDCTVLELTYKGPR